MTATTKDGDFGIKVLDYAASKPQHKSAVDWFITRKVGFDTLGDFVTARGGEYDADDLAVLRTVLVALVDDNPEVLGGAPSVAVVKPAAVAPVKLDRGALADAGPAVTVDVEIEIPPPKARTETLAPPVGQGNDPAAVIAAAIAAIARQNAPEAKAPEIDPAAIEKAAVEAAKAQGEAVLEQVQDALANASAKTAEALREIEAKLDARPAVDVVVKMGDREIKVDGRQHYKFPLLVKAMAAGLNVLLVGPAGTGKSHAAMMAAKGLGLDFEAISVGPQTSKGDLFGYRDAGGQYRDTALVRCAVTGKVLVMDELDAGHPGVLTGTNMVLSNGHVPLPDGPAEKHKDFRLVGTANTYGMGANRQYVGRNQLDAATLDRYVVLDWPNDDGLAGAFIGLDVTSPALDLAAGGVMEAQAWFDYWQAVRGSIDRQGQRIIVSPRALTNGMALFNQGVGREHVEAMVLWKGADADMVRKIKEGM